MTIAHETIYRHIYSGHSLRNRLYGKLRRKHVYRIKRGGRKSRIPKMLLIENRPDEIGDQVSFGH